MLSLVLPLTSLLGGAVFLLLGGGLLGTLLAVRGGLAGFGDQALGLMMSAYFLGFFFGTYLAPPLIRRIGHIRAFAFFAAINAAAVLLHAIWIDPWAWGALRVVTGIALVGLYTVIESWLNAHARGEQRGRVFAVYMALTLLALAAGQQLLRLDAPDSFALFSLVAILACAAMLPVTATRLAQPGELQTPSLGLAALYRSAPAAAAGALGSGLLIGTFWGLGPVYATRIGLDVAGVATFMSAGILGGAALQWPIGRLSDRADRRQMLGLVGVAAAALAALIAVLPPGGALTAAFFVFGGLAFAIYPVSVAHLLDHLSPQDVLAGCSGVLMLHGVGAAVGPALAGAAMQGFGAAAWPVFLAAVPLALAAFVGGRLAIRRRERPHPAQFHPMLRTTPTALELLPESRTGEAG